jgi:hypothetical protein
MSNHNYFELQRKSDDLVYQFDRKLTTDGKIGYCRRDQDLLIVFHQDFCWIACGNGSEFVTGRPWNILPKDQNPDHPPEGEWVSKKDDKSYVYVLKYT